MEALAREPVGGPTEQALYVYCIVPGSQEVRLGPIGLEKSVVYTIACYGMSAVVHECVAHPYQSQDRAVVEGWVLAHERVVENAWKRFGSVLPMSFDVIVKKGGEEGSAREAIVEWLEEKRTEFIRRLRFLAGKAEYGVQVLWDPKVIAADILAGHASLRAREREIESQPEGLAYIHREKLQREIKARMEERAGEYFGAFYARISECVHDARIEAPKKTDDGLQMLVNASCLLEAGQYDRLGQALDEVAEMRGITVRFTGPWPPYSFAGAGSARKRRKEPGAS